jgi:hypothetical protein
VVRDADNEPVLVEAVQTDDPALICQWSREPNHLATVRIGVRREAVTNGEAHALVRVQISKPVRATIPIPVTRVPE